MQNAQPAKTPLEASLPLLKATPSDQLADKQLDQELIGSLNHLAVFWRPDISNAVSQLSQFLATPTESHLKAARHVLRYLKKQAHSLSHMGKINLISCVSLDSLIRIGEEIGMTGNLILGICSVLTDLHSHGLSESRLQLLSRLSTMEAEYMALSDASREAIAHVQQLTELKVVVPPATLLSDNQGALEIADNPSDYQWAKHIDIRYHFIRHALKTDKISIYYIPSSENPSDILTKAWMLKNTKNGSKGLVYFVDRSQEVF